MKNCPTYEKFCEMVFDDLKRHWQGRWSDSELRAQMNEQKDIIEREYEGATQKLRSGEITEQIFQNGCVNSVAYCLYLLY
ncbi:MAG: hypothetical protein K6G73_12365 [Marinilabiliaceae bacterium]|nr:hypothetical protein [Marinilabiliaceae bacterium]